MIDGPDRLKLALNLAGNTRNAARWSAEEWLRLSYAFGKASHDFTPDRWTARQIREALRKRNPLSPQWDNEEYAIGGLPLDV